MSQVQALQCDFYGQGHANGNSIPEGVTKEAQYGNKSLKGNSYSNTYDLS